MTKEKTPPRRKISKIKELKKPILAGGIITVIAIAGIIVGTVLLEDVNDARGNTLVLV
ncbi:unnamed protein product, partial [marine sediment metagenome]